MAGNVLSVSPSGTSVYRSRVTRFDGKSRDITWTWTTTGTLTGTLIVQGTNSAQELIDKDQAGGTDTTDAADWKQYKHILTESGAAGHNIAVSGAGGDYIELVDAPFRAMRVQYTNATNSGTLDVDAVAKAEGY